MKIGIFISYFLVRKIPFTGIELTSQRVRRLEGYENVAIIYTGRLSSWYSISLSLVAACETNSGYSFIYSMYSSSAGIKKQNFCTENWRECMYGHHI